MTNRRRFIKRTVGLGVALPFLTSTFGKANDLFRIGRPKKANGPMILCSRGEYWRTGPRDRRSEIAIDPRSVEADNARPRRRREDEVGIDPEGRILDGQSRHRIGASDG